MFGIPPHDERAFSKFIHPLTQSLSSIEEVARAVKGIPQVTSDLAEAYLYQSSDVDPSIDERGLSHSLAASLLCLYGNPILNHLYILLNRAGFRYC
jgi:hypothetical protein